MLMIPITIYIYKITERKAQLNRVLIIMIIHKINNKLVKRNKTNAQ